MKSINYLFILLLLFTIPGCATYKITAAQGVSIGQPLVTAGMGAVLRNNPKYIPIAQKVGPDLKTANYTDLTVTGINATVATIVAKEGGDADLALIIETALDSGLAGYLGAVEEANLAKDPYAQLVLQALGQSVTDGAAWALANPKP